jgi:hypothetical protein
MLTLLGVRSTKSQSTVESNSVSRSMSMEYFIQALIEEQKASSVKIVSDPAMTQWDCRNTDRKPRSKSFDVLPTDTFKRRHPRRISSFSRWDNSVSLEEEAAVKVIPPIRRASPLRPTSFPHTDTALGQTIDTAECSLRQPLRHSDSLPRRPSRQDSILRPGRLHRQCSWASSV